MSLVSQLERKKMNLETLLTAAYCVTAVGTDLMKRVVEKAVKDGEEKLMGHLGKYVTEFQTDLKDSVVQLRTQRAAMRKLQDSIKQKDRAFQYFCQEGNPLPYLKLSGKSFQIRDFCHTAGIPVPDDDSDAYKVPNDFKPEVPDSGEVAE